MGGLRVFQVKSLVRQLTVHSVYRNTFRCQLNAGVDAAVLYTIGRASPIGWPPDRHSAVSNQLRCVITDSLRITEGYWSRNVVNYIKRETVDGSSLSFYLDRQIDRKVSSIRRRFRVLCSPMTGCRGQSASRGNPQRPALNTETESGQRQTPFMARDSRHWRLRTCWVLAMVGVDASDSTDWCSPNAVDRPRACCQKMGAGLNPLGAAPGHYHTGPMHPSPTRPRATPAPDSDPPSNGRRAPQKLLRPTLLATVAAAPLALAVQAFRGTASSPKTMGRVLVHLTMLSTASGWQLPQSMAPEETITGEAHGGVDRRRLASACNGGWYVRPHARASPP